MHLRLQGRTGRLGLSNGAMQAAEEEAGGNGEAAKLK
jgi:hypothetical protein